MAEVWLENRPRAPGGECEMGAVDIVNVAAIPEPPDRRSALDPEQLDARITAREHKYHSDAARGDLLELRAQIVRRSEEHTSELQSQSNLVCRLLLEKKKKHTQIHLCINHIVYDI